jgi:hypothetical protein
LLTLPDLSQINFGGAPRRITNSTKSLSLLISTARIPGGIKNCAVGSVPEADVAKCYRADFKGLFNPPCEMRR